LNENIFHGVVTAITMGYWWWLQSKERAGEIKVLPDGAQSY